MFTEGDTTTDTATVHWRRQGRGPAIVLLHGFPLDGRTWDGVVHGLRDRYTCYTLDLIGLGRSRGTKDADYASQGQASALCATLRALGVDSYALVGNDTGGWVARELALLDRRRVSHLVLTNTEIPGHRPPWIPMYQALAHVPGFGSALRVLLGIPAFLASPLAFGGCFHDPARIDGEFRERYVVPLLEPGAARAGVLRFLRCMKFRRLDEFRSLHAKLTMPTLFIWGADDPTFPESLARRMAEQLPNVKGFHSIANAKLFFHEEQPEVIATLVAGLVECRQTR